MPANGLPSVSFMSCRVEQEQNSALQDAGCWTSFTVPAETVTFAEFRCTVRCIKTQGFSNTAGSCASSLRWALCTLRRFDAKALTFTLSAHAHARHRHYDLGHSVIGVTIMRLPEIFTSHSSVLKRTPLFKNWAVAWPARYH